LILIFIGVPILEIVVFIQAGDIIGLWPTIAAVVATAIIGGALIRAQGLATMGDRRPFTKPSPASACCWRGRC
jgi:UPF0716 family protein affecting phage T7 exclusion